MNAYLRLIRPSVVALGSFGALVGALVAGFYDPFEIIIAMLVVFFIGGAGNAINDYYDYQIDKTNKPTRPIPSGLVERKNVYRFAKVFYILGIAFCFLISIYCFALALFSVFLTWLYSAKLKTKMPIGNFIASWFAASTFLFGGLLTETVNVTVLVLFVMAFFGSMGREITKDIEDMVGDKKGGKKTIPLIFGENFARNMAIIFIVVAVLLTPIPYIFSLSNMYYTSIVAVCDIIFIYALTLLKKKPAQSQKWMKIAMFVGIAAFIAGTL